MKTRTILTRDTLEIVSTTMPKATTPTSSRQERRHNPLENDVLATGLLRQKAPKSKKSKKTDEDRDGSNVVDSKSSEKILRLGRELLEEDRENTVVVEQTPNAFSFASRFDQPDEHVDQPFEDEEDMWADEDEIVEEIEVDAKDLETFNRFLPSDQDQDPLLKHGWDGPANGAGAEEAQGVKLADIILAKIAEFESSIQGRPEVPVPDEYEMNPKIVEVFST